MNLHVNKNLSMRWSRHLRSVVVFLVAVAAVISILLNLQSRSNLETARQEVLASMAQREENRNQQLIARRADERAAILGNCLSGEEISDVLRRLVKVATTKNLELRRVLLLEIQPPRDCQEFVDGELPAGVGTE